MASERVLIVEDDKEIQQLLKLYLDNEFAVYTAEDGEEVLRCVEEIEPDLILLDILLPKLNGIDACKKLRLKGKTAPVIFLSCKRENEDKIIGLDAGGDDYITKPFDPGEVVARVKAHLRRAKMNQGSFGESSDGVKTFGSLKINVNSYTVSINNKPVSLYAKEMQLLLFFVNRPGQVFSTEQLYDQVWGTDRYGDMKTVMVHISNLRKKIEENPAVPLYIQTIRGFGYKFNPVTI
nr:response regulator transcription factor [Alteribacter populi]